MDQLVYVDRRVGRDIIPTLRTTSASRTSRRCSSRVGRARAHGAGGRAAGRLGAAAARLEGQRVEVHRSRAAPRCSSPRSRPPTADPRTTRCCSTATSTSSPSSGWRDGPRPLGARHRGRPALRPRRRRRRLRHVRRADRHRGRRAGGVPHRRCVVLIEASEESGSPDLPAHIDVLGRPHRHAEPRRVPRLGLRSTTTASGSPPRCAGCSPASSGRGAHRRRALRRRQRRDPLDVPHRPPAARPHRGRDDRRDPRRASSTPTSPPTGRQSSDETAEGSAKTLAAGSRSSTASDRSPTTRPSSSSSTARGSRARDHRRRRPAPATGAGNVLRPSTSLYLSLRIPPTARPRSSGRRARAALTADPPYGATVSYARDKPRPAGTRRPFAPWLGTLHGASRHVRPPPPRSAKAARSRSWACSASKFPDAQFVVTGVLGPGSNAHGPNEFLHLPTARKLTAARRCSSPATRPTLASVVGVRAVGRCACSRRRRRRSRPYRLRCRGTVAAIASGIPRRLTAITSATRANPAAAHRRRLAGGHSPVVGAAVDGGDHGGPDRRPHVARHVGDAEARRPSPPARRS